MPFHTVSSILYKVFSIHGTSSHRRKNTKYKIQNTKYHLRLRPGLGMLMVFLFFFVISSIAALLFSKTQFYIRFSAKQVAKDQAQVLADAGVDYAMWQLNRVDGTPNTPPGQQIAIGGGEVETIVDPPGTSDKTITSTAYIPSKANHHTQAIVKVQA